MCYKHRRHGVLLLLLIVLVFLPAGSAQSIDVLEIVAIPAPPNVQASIDVILACENGVAFGFNAMNRRANLAEGSRPWDISFALDGELLIEEYPLVLSESLTPLRYEGYRFPFRAFHTLLWSETVEQESIESCIAGAGSGFCSIELPIDACRIEPNIVANVAQIGPNDTTPLVTDKLVYEVQAYDPALGAVNGAGIESVELKILDYGQGVERFSNLITTTTNVDGMIAYCAFSPTCEPWDMAANGYTWPDGEPATSGVYLLRAIVTTTDNGRALVQQEFELRIQKPPDVAMVPGGEFTLGTETGTSSEAPAHTVSVDDFWIMQTEVTNAQYRACVEDHACTKPVDNPRWNDAAYAEHPVVSITWQQANDYATWIGGRLPTEAEWEAACRSTDARVYPWGDETPNNDLANFNQHIGDTTPVGSYPVGANPYGLLDMSGNVWEWTSSLFAPYPYDATDGREETLSFQDRSVRGGSHYYTQYQLACSSRTHSAPQTADGQIGLRVVFDAPVTAAPVRAVRIVEPADGATVNSPFTVGMEAEGLIVESAGVRRPNAGHFHILIDADFVPPEELIPFDDNHRHFGDGAATTQLDLAPGEHTLRLQFANGAHEALEGDEFRDEITVIVE